MRMQLEITSQKRGNYFWKNTFGVKNSYVVFGQILMRIDDVKNYVAKLYLGKNYKIDCYKKYLRDKAQIILHRMENVSNFRPN